jgi:plastocyanin
MKRSIISMIGILTFCGIALSASSATADDKDREKNVTVSFGQWDPNDPDLTAPLDRLVGDPTVPPGAGVNDHLIPDNVTINAGGAVNFIIGGGHVVAVYDKGTKPRDIDTTVTEPADRCPTTAGGVINDPIDRIYRGPCHSTNVGTTPSTTIVRRDGVETVQFSKPGTYLVICARKNHFINSTTGEFQMFGFVKVLPVHAK